MAIGRNVFIAKLNAKGEYAKSGRQLKDGEVILEEVEGRADQVKVVFSNHDLVTAGEVFFVRDIEPAIPTTVKVEVYKDTSALP